MKTHITQFCLAVLMYVAVCLLTIIVIKPFSVLIFIGSAAGIASAIILLWGTHLLAAVFFASLLLNIILSQYFSIPFNLPIFMITTLSVCLQGFWVKRLTYRVISTQRWLDSRAMLISFILKIGPLASIVSASTSVLISVIYVKEFDANLFYVFCRTWSASTLISVFSIPVLLFFQGKQQLNSGKRIFVIISSILGGISIALLFKIFQDQHQHYRADDFYKAKNFVISELSREIVQTEQQLQAAKAYFETSTSISLDNFNEFSAYVMGDNSTIEALEWVPVVQHENRNTYEQYVSKLLDFTYQISQQTLSGDKIAHPESAFYMPVQYVFPRYQNEELLSINVYGEVQKKRAIDRAIETQSPSATIPISFIEGEFDDPVINVVLPVYGKYLEPSFGELKLKERQVIKGVIIGVVKLSRLFSRISKYADNANVNVYITGYDNGSQFVVYGQQIDTLNRLVETNKTSVYSREWQYSISEKAPWVLQTKKWQTWAMLFGGTFGGLIFQMLILMMAAYSTELGFRVANQTRELILSKEKSDKENHAKTQFLQSLSSELRIPLSVISRLIEVFPTQNLNSNEKEYITNVSNAALNLEQLVDTLNELSTIESGKLILNKQSFDFLLFLSRMEDILEAQNKNIQFIVQKDTPQFIKTDELRLQQVFINCAECACDIFPENDLSISVKVHFHQQSQATIVFVVTSSGARYDTNYGVETEELSHSNLKISMAKELANRLDGNVALAKLPSGQIVINVSIKVLVSQDNEYEFGRFNQLLSDTDTKPQLLKQALFVEAEGEGNVSFCSQLRALGYHLVVKKVGEPVDYDLYSFRYSLVVYDCSDPMSKVENIALLEDKHLVNVPTLAVFNQPPTDDMLTTIHNKFSYYIVLPITTESLDNMLRKHLS